MKEYLILQLRMTNRKLREFGLNPVAGYFVLLAGFAGLSVFLFAKTEFAQYVLVLVSLALTSGLSETKRNDFIRMCFSDVDYRKIRIIENLLVSAPFVLFLVYRQCFVSALVLALISLILGLKRFNTAMNFVLPTPFSRRPFEFVVGFRNTFFIFPLAYSVTCIAIAVDNFNLGIFSLLLVFLPMPAFYVKPENEYYVWMFAMKPQVFLLKKIQTALVFSTILVLPVLAALLCFYPGEAYTIILFYLAACAVLVTVVLAKYSAYPGEMNLPQVMMIAFSLYFPPLLLAIAPYFYFQSVRHLKPYLV